jgi:DNA-binding CsgD family transcriptional regulator
MTNHPQGIYPKRSLAVVIGGLAAYLSWGFVYFQVVGNASATDLVFFANRLALIASYAGFMVLAVFFSRMLVPLRPSNNVTFLTLAVVGVFLAGFSYAVPGFAAFLSLAGSLLVGVQYGWFLLYWCELFGYAQTRCAGFCFGAAMLLVPAVCYAAFVLPDVLQVFAAALLPVLSYLGFLHGMNVISENGRFKDMDKRVGKLQLNVDSPRFPWRTSELFGILKAAIMTSALFGFVFGVVDAGFGKLYYWAVGFGIVGLVVTMLLALRPKRLSIRFLYRLSQPVMVFGLMALGFSTALGGVLVSTAFSIELLLLVVTLCETANRFETSVVRLGGFAFSCTMISSAAGRVVGKTAMDAAAGSSFVAMALVAAMTCLFVLYTAFTPEDGGFLFEFSDRAKPDGDVSPTVADRMRDPDPRDMEVSVVIFHEAVNRRCADVAGEYGLSNREEEVLVHIMQGNSIQEVADKLFISPGTVKTHINHIYRKMGVTRRYELKRIVNLEQKGTPPLV